MLVARLLRLISDYWAGCLVCSVITLASYFLADAVGGPAVLYCLFLGAAMHFVTRVQATDLGIAFCAKRVLQIGVTLLGAKITAENLSLLSLPMLALVISGVALTFGVGMLCNRWCRWPQWEAGVCSGSVAICGASAAAALALVVPNGKLREESLIAVIVAVATWSTLAMVTYPFLVTWAGLEGEAAGAVLGGTIHDVSQVVGAGAMLENAAALESATLIKMVRVACLVPAMLVFAWIAARQGAAQEGEKPAAGRVLKAVPPFLWGFVLLTAASVSGAVPQALGSALGQISSVCIVLSIAGIGLKTNLAKLREVGWKPLAIMSVATIALFVWVLAGVLAFRFTGIL